MLFPVVSIPLTLRLRGDLESPIYLNMHETWRKHMQTDQDSNLGLSSLSFLFNSAGSQIVQNVKEV